MIQTVDQRERMTFDAFLLEDWNCGLQALASDIVLRQHLRKTNWPAQEHQNKKPITSGSIPVILLSPTRPVRPWAKKIIVANSSEKKNNQSTFRRKMNKWIWIYTGTL